MRNIYTRVRHQIWGMTKRDDVWDATIFLLTRVGETRIQSVLFQILVDKLADETVTPADLERDAIPQEFRTFLIEDIDVSETDPTTIRLRDRALYADSSPPSGFRTVDLTELDAIPSENTVRRVLNYTQSRGYTTSHGGGRRPAIWRLTTRGMDYFNIEDQTRFEILFDRATTQAYRSEREVRRRLKSRDPDALDELSQDDFEFLLNQLAN